MDDLVAKNTAVIGIFRTQSHTAKALDALFASGFGSDDISILWTRDMVTEKNTKAPEGTTIGVVIGGMIGGTLGLLAGIGTLAIPGLAPLIAAGPVMGTLAGIGAGATTGALIGAVAGMTIPEYEAVGCRDPMKDGCILLSIHCHVSDSMSKAQGILMSVGAEDIASSGAREPATGLY